MNCMGCKILAPIIQVENDHQHNHPDVNGAAWYTSNPTPGLICEKHTNSRGVCTTSKNDRNVWEKTKNVQTEQSQQKQLTQLKH